MGIYNTQGQKDLSDRLAEDLDEWLLEVRHYHYEADQVKDVIRILKSYGNSPLDRRGNTDNDT